MGKILPNKKTDFRADASAGSSKSKQGSKRKIALLIIGSILVYAVFFGSAAFISYYLLNTKVDDSSLSVSEPWVPTTYDMMTESQISVKLYNDTGKGLGEIENGTPSKELLPSFEKAYSAAQAMYYINNYTKSLELYAFADTYNSKSKTYIFYLDYAALAQTIDNNEILTKQAENAMSEIKKSTSLSNTQKDELTTLITEKLAPSKVVR